MSHEITATDSIGYYGEVPWHGIGTGTDKKLPVREFAKLAGLLYGLKKVETRYNWTDADGKSVYRPTGDFALIRDDTGAFLTNVSDDWHPCPNDKAFDFFNEFVELGHMFMHTAGSLRGGRIMWAMASLDDGFEVFGKDPVKGNLLFVNPHIYGQKIKIFFTTVRAVCWNTVSLAISQDSKGDGAVAFDHRLPFDAEKAKDMLGIATLKTGLFKESAEFLASKRYKEEALKDYLREVYPISEEARTRRELTRPSQRVLELVETSPGHDLFPESWWNVLNAVTYFVDHDPQAGQNADNRLTNAWLGGARKRKVFALEKAIEYASAA